MPDPLPLSKEELDKLLKDPKALVRRMILSFALERPKLMGPPGPRRPRG